MSYNSNAIEIIPDSDLWATEEEYRDWDRERKHSHDDRHSRFRGGREQSPNKKSRVDRDREKDGAGAGTSKSREIGRMFFRTKLCSKFRAGTCPYETTCNFAHGMEELRKPPPNWQEIVADHGEASEKLEECQIPILTSSNNTGGEAVDRPQKLRHCKKFYTDEGCPYGDACVYLHDEQSRARESVAISLSPTVGGGANGYYAASGPSGVGQKPSNWKTRICNKWEMTGYCPFGPKCHFAHGSSELSHSKGPDGRDSPSMTDAKHSGSVAKALGEASTASATLLPRAGRALSLNQSSANKARQIWKGPDKINRIYGDWIDDPE